MIYLSLFLFLLTFHSTFPQRTFPNGIVWWYIVNCVASKWTQMDFTNDFIKMVFVCICMNLCVYHLEGPDFIIIMTLSNRNTRNQLESATQCVNESVKLVFFLFVEQQRTHTQWWINAVHCCCCCCCYFYCQN